MSGHAPVFQPIADQMAVVGVELSFEMRATDADGDRIVFGFNAPSIADLKTRLDPATLSSFSNGVAVFRWTPSAKDVSQTAIQFDFTASDGTNFTHETAHITVGTSTGGGPIFRSPLGGGTTLDLTSAACTSGKASDCCVQVPVVIDDVSATTATIADEAPRIMGATIQTTGPFKANWKWCPSDAQKSAAQMQYSLILSADDGASPKVTRSPYLIILRKMAASGCAGNPPVITHTPYTDAVMGEQDIEIDATITDDIGVKGPPVVYFKDSPPDNPSDVFTWTLKTMTRVSGTAQNGMYSVVLPNPIAGSDPGTMDTLYYVISATDGDDPTGACNHTVEAPVTDTFTVDLENDGNVIPLGICTACSNDAQCGPGNYCAAIVSGSSDSFCSPVCTDGCDAAGFHCGTQSNSIGGHLAQYCVPDSGNCSGVSVNSCIDDDDEPNDSQSAATRLAAPGTYDNLILCPNDVYNLNDDWYAVALGAGDTLTAVMTGLGTSDLDLDIDSPDGTLVGYSGGNSDNEQASAKFCTGGLAYVHIYALPNGSAVAEDGYSLTFSIQPGSCP